MGPSTKTVGGGPASGLANDFVNFLQSGINTGSFGGMSAGQQFNAADPYASTQGIAGALNNLLSGGTGQLSSLHQMLSMQNKQDVKGLRSRFGAGGGTAFGTPAAYGEGVLRSQNAVNQTNALGQLQLQNQMAGLQAILPYLAGTAGKGISQAENITSPSPWMSLLSAGIGGAASYFGAKNPRSGFDPSMFGGGAPTQQTMFPGGLPTYPTPPALYDNTPIYHFGGL